MVQGLKFCNFELCHILELNKKPSTYYFLKFKGFGLFVSQVSVVKFKFATIY